MGRQDNKDDRNQNKIKLMCSLRMIVYILT